MRKQRIEDLGRICERLNILCEHDIFEWLGSNRCKEAEEWFFSLPKERQEDIIHKLAYGIENVHSELHDLYSIARWGDDDTE